MLFTDALYDIKAKFEKNNLPIRYNVIKKVPIIHDSGFMPIFTKSLLYTLPISIRARCDNIDVNLYCFGMSMGESMNALKFINMCIFFLKHIKKTGMTSFEIYLYACKDKKELPRDDETVLGPVNINSGFSFNDGNTCVIFRQEEMEKVILHELVHRLKIECAVLQAKDDNISKKYGIYCKNLTLRVPEAYTDTVACLLLLTFKCKSKKSFQALLKKSIDFMRQQALKVIGFYKGKTWMEASHVFSYYVVKSIIFNNLGMVETWLGSSMDTFDRQEDFYNFITKIIDKDFPTLRLQAIQNAGFDLRMIDVDLNYIFA